MKSSVMTAIAMSMVTLFLCSSEEDATNGPDKKEVAEVGKKSPPANPDRNMKRRWTKRSKPGAPKARKAPPSRKRVATLEEEHIISMDEEDVDIEEEFFLEETE